MYNKTRSGFTLIELLVVISIIGMLSSVILVALTKARDKAINSKIQQSLVQMRVAANLLYSDEGSYDGVCNSPTEARRSYNAALAESGAGIDTEDGYCYSEPTFFIAVVRLKAPEGDARIWCVDSALHSNATSIAETPIDVLISALSDPADPTFGQCPSK